MKIITGFEPTRIIENSHHGRIGVVKDVLESTRHLEKFEEDLEEVAPDGD